MNNPSCPVAVFGEMLVDQFPDGAVVGGAPFNVARHLAAFGHDPLMLSAVGRDAAAQLVMAEFERFGMRRSGVQVAQRHPTGVVDVEMADDGSHRFHIRGGSAWDVIEGPPAFAAAAPQAGGWLCSGTLALRSPQSRATGLALMRRQRGKRYLDLNWREGHVARGVALEAAALADILKVNDDELAMLCDWLGARAGPMAVEEAARWVLGRLTLDMLLVTCGAEGSAAFGGDGICVARAPAAPIARLVDTVGAGDSFSAVVIAGLLRGWEMGVTLRRANDFAGHICEIRGAVPAERAAYADWTRDW